jgi:arsenate reductase (glutaredoxin)
MQMIHNNYCTKSLCALDLVNEKQLSVELIDYMNKPLNGDQIADLLNKLNMTAFELVRKSEPVYIKNFEGKYLTEDEWIDAMVQYPVLIERPIFINGDKAVIGRPAERVFEIL